MVDQGRHWTVFGPPLYGVHVHTATDGEEPVRRSTAGLAQGPVHNWLFPEGCPEMTGHNAAQQKSKEADWEVSAGMAPGELPLDVAWEPRRLHKAQAWELWFDVGTAKAVLLVHRSRPPSSLHRLGPFRRFKRCSKGGAWRSTLYVL